MQWKTQKIPLVIFILLTEIKSKSKKRKVKEKKEQREKESTATNECQGICEQGECRFKHMGKKQ